MTTIGIFLSSEEHTPLEQAGFLDFYAREVLPRFR